MVLVRNVYGHDGRERVVANLDVLKVFLPGGRRAFLAVGGEVFGLMERPADRHPYWINLSGAVAGVPEGCHKMFVDRETFKRVAAEVERRGAVVDLRNGLPGEIPGGVAEVEVLPLFGALYVRENGHYVLKANGSSPRSVRRTRTP